MRTDKTLQTPIMTNSESVLQFGNNAYGKPATALNILRETVMGRELFDLRFQNLRHALGLQAPAASRLFPHDGRRFGGGFGLVLARLVLRHRPLRPEPGQREILPRVNSKNPGVEKSLLAERALRRSCQSLSAQRVNQTDIKQTAVDEKPELKDFYNGYDPLSGHRGRQAALLSPT